MNIRLTGITKRFPGTLANDAVSLEIVGGEVHCLLGENGAGKSTLIGMLAGLQQPDAGTIEIDGAPVVLSSPAVSLAHGIGVVYQHSTLIPSFTVLENLLLGDTRRLRIDRQAGRARLAELAHRVGAVIDPDRRAGDLSLGEQQQVEIVKALWRGSRVLVLDEPTSMLVPQAVESLMRTIDRLRGEGIAVVFVTHKLHEAHAVGDTVTVLRGGRVVGRITAPELRGMSEAEASERILAAMFGGADRDAFPETGGSRALARTPREARPVLRVAAPVVLGVDALSTAAEASETPVCDVSFEIRAGEILGIAGVDGHGQRHLAEAIAGQREAAHGLVTLNGADVTGRGVRARQRLGVRYVTDDRLHEGIVGSLSVAVNLVLKRIGDAPLWKWGRMNTDAVARVADERIAAFDIRTPSRDTRAGTLSGGNIQKLLLARELADEPSVVVVHKPTYGLDLRTVAHVRDVVREFARAGGAVLLISSDLDELEELSHRILVLSGGAIVGEVDNAGDRVAERVGSLMVGARP